MLSVIQISNHYLGIPQAKRASLLVLSSQLLRYDSEYIELFFEPFLEPPGFELFFELLLLGLSGVEPFLELQLPEVEPLVELELSGVEPFLDLPVLSEIELLLGFSGVELFLELRVELFLELQLSESVNLSLLSFFYVLHFSP